MENDERDAQAIAVHHALWDPNAHSVMYDGVEYPIVRRQSSRQDFAMVTLNNSLRYVTQNMCKSSKWTDWVHQHRSHQLTWVFRGQQYSARIQTSDRYGDTVELLGVPATPASRSSAKEERVG